MAVSSVPQAKVRGRVLSAEQAFSFFFRRWKFMTIVFVVALLVIAVPLMIIGSNYYKSEMQVLVLSSRSDAPLSAEQTTPVSKPVTLDQVTSETEIMTGRDIVEQVVNVCGIANYDHHWTDFLHSSDPQVLHDRKLAAAVDGTAKKIKAKTDFGSDLITVSYASFGSPQRPACVLSETAKLYLEKHATLERPAGTSEFFANTAATSKIALQKAESNLADFTKTIGEAPEVLRTSLTQQLSLQEAALAQAKETMAVDSQKITFIDRKLRSTPSRSAAAESTTPSVLLIQTLVGDLVNAQNRRSLLVLKYEPTYPLVTEADAEIRTISSALDEAKAANNISKTTEVDPIYAALRLQANQAETELSTQRTSEIELEKNISKLHSEIAQTDQNQIQEAALQRETTAAATSYLLYLSKRDQEITSDALDRKGIANVAIAVPPSVPVLPAYSNSLILLVSIVLAAFLALGGTLIFERLDSRFWEPQQVETSLGVPVLASLPK
jgi:uncharacterized protein involved in exopolysaccharide biosynthesis